MIRDLLSFPVPFQWVQMYRPQLREHHCSTPVGKYQRDINLCRTAVRKLKDKTDPAYHFSTILETPLPTRSSCPKTVFSPSAEQFHLPYRNWYWHSLIPICAPSPITMMASGRLWQIARCRGAKPGILLQMILAPKATTDDKALKKKKQKDTL